MIEKKCRLLDLQNVFEKKNVYKWTKEHNEALEKVKEILCSPAILKRFDPAKPAVLLTDALRLGLGYILIQPDVKPEGHEKDNLADGITKHTGKKVPKGHLITCG